MTAIIGLVVLMICVFGGFVIAGGSLAPIIKAAPYEGFIIAGAGIGGMITGNSSVIFKGAMGGFGRGSRVLNWEDAAARRFELLVSRGS